MQNILLVEDDHELNSGDGGSDISQLEGVSAKERGLAVYGED